MAVLADVRDALAERTPRHCADWASACLGEACLFAEPRQALAQ